MHEPFRSTVNAPAIGTLVGGIGLFLLGMSLMTDSLTALGGGALRALLGRLSRRPLLALATGAVATAVLQSSSATTLVTVGFVSAGLLSFADSLALIFGANLGTTSTAWIVALIGLKVKVSAVALPLVGIGALVRLVSRGRRARFGLAVAGFGLVFVGIDVMQSGMAQVDLDVGALANVQGPLGVLALAGIGALMTVVMQSSSAAVATTLVALDAGYLTLLDAAALVVGQNVGTTVTAILGAAGGRLAARRAAVAHTLFNTATGAVALALLGPFVAVGEAIGARAAAEPSPELAIAIFHTAFNVFGVALFFPFVDRFARAVERLVPERNAVALEPPSTAVLQVPALALEAARKGAAATAREAVALCAESLRRTPDVMVEFVPWRRILALTDPRAILTGEDEATRKLVARVRGLRVAVDDLATYLGRVRTSGHPTPLRDEHVEILHAVDHLRRLVTAIEDADTLELTHRDPDLRRISAELADALAPIPEALDESTEPIVLARCAGMANAAAAACARHRDAHRVITLARLADGDVTTDEADARLHAARWLGKFPKRTHRALLHLGWTAGSRPPADDPED